MLNEALRRMMYLLDITVSDLAKALNGESSRIRACLDDSHELTDEEAAEILDTIENIAISR